MLLSLLILGLGMRKGKVFARGKSSEGSGLRTDERRREDRGDNRKKKMRKGLRR
jgi:hypothetical protein